MENSWVHAFSKGMYDAKVKLNKRKSKQKEKETIKKQKKKAKKIIKNKKSFNCV